MASEAVAVKKDLQGGNVLTLSTGVRAIIRPVSQAIIQDAVGRVEVPQVPMWYNPDKEREEENPLDPGYLVAQREYQRQMQRITFDSFALFGVELVDGVPKGDAWLKQLRLAERLGNLDLSGFDPENDSVDREFLFKRYVAMGDRDYITVATRAGFSEEDVQAAAATFQGDEVSDPDNDVPAEELSPDGNTV